MRTSLGSVMANIILAELESEVIKFLISNDAIKFYFWYVDDTVLVVKPQCISRTQKLLNGFNKNLVFTIKFPIFLTWKSHRLDFRSEGY